VTSEVIAGYTGIDDAEYRRRIRAWTLYDWANSAFFTTVLAAVLPVYYSHVAGSTLGSPAKATQYWTITLAIALVIVAVVSPILGTVSDILRAKKAFLAMFTAIGVMGVGLLVLVGSGDWLLASAFLIIGRIGAAGAIVFYDSLLPHVARPEDQDRVSTRGYAIGYLGGGLLLAVNIVMIFTLGDTLGARLSFVTVAVWWAVFSIPILRRVPEPPAAGSHLAGTSILRATFSRLRETFNNLRRYRHLFRYLIAFLIYNDGIGTIIGVAVIYGAELGFGSVELVAAILLVQFVGIPFSLIFGRIPSRDERLRAVFLAFVLWNLIMIPLAGIAGRFLLADDVTGARLPEFTSTATAVGEGEYAPGSTAVDLQGAWTVRSESDLPSAADGAYAFTSEVGDEYRLRYHGQKVEVTYAEGPDRGKWDVLIDGEPVMDGDDPLVIDGYNEADRFELTEIIDAGDGGEHVLSIVNTADRDADATGTVMSIGQTEVLPAPRVSSLGTILGLLLVIEIVGLALASLFGRSLLGGLADTMSTKRTIILSLIVYSAVAVWGFVLDTVIEFWYLAWMVAIVQGGSQALSRSLYASMSPTTESGEFFGFFSVMSKVSAIIGPLVFALAVALFGSSRPAVLSIIVFFLVGIVLLTRVDVDEGRRAAQEADREAAAAHLVRGD
jgi:UMF1 family MFS transporter